MIPIKTWCTVTEKATDPPHAKLLKCWPASNQDRTTDQAHTAVWLCSVALQCGLVVRSPFNLIRDEVKTSLPICSRLWGGEIWTRSTGPSLFPYKFMQFAGSEFERNFAETCISLEGLWVNRAQVVYSLTLGSRGFSLSESWCRNDGQLGRGDRRPSFRPQLSESEKRLEPRAIFPGCAVQDCATTAHWRAVSTVYTCGRSCVLTTAPPVAGICRDSGTAACRVCWRTEIWWWAETNGWQLNPFTPELKKCILPTFQKAIVWVM